MILADKIITLRKKAGWSQEELAEKLGVTRQSVSKWEGAQSIPDMEKILMLSRLFCVSTDALLKDELDLSESVPAADTGHTETQRRIVTMEEAYDYLEKRRIAAPKMAAAAMLAVLCPIPLLLLAGLSELPGFPLTENAASGMGLCLLLCFAAAAAVLFRKCAADVRDYAFLDRDPFETAYGVTGMVRERKASFRAVYDRCSMTGLLFCIFSVVPLFLAICFDAADIVYIAAVCALLFLAGCGTCAFVRGGVYQGAMDRLLEEGDFTRESKSKSAVIGTVSAAYWLIVTAVFFLVTYLPAIALPYKDSWIVWAVAGVLYAALITVLKQLCGGKSPK